MELGHAIGVATLFDNMLPRHPNIDTKYDDECAYGNESVGH